MTDERRAASRAASRTLAHDHALRAADLLDVAESVNGPALRASCAAEAAAHATLAVFYQREAEVGQPSVIYPPLDGVATDDGDSGGRP